MRHLSYDSRLVYGNIWYPLLNMCYYAEYESFNCFGIELLQQIQLTI